MGRKYYGKYFLLISLTIFGLIAYIIYVLVSFMQWVYERKRKWLKKIIFWVTLVAILLVATVSLTNHFTERKICAYKNHSFLEEGHQYKKYWICDRCDKDLEDKSGIALKERMIKEDFSQIEIEWAERTWSPYRRNWIIEEIKKRNVIDNDSNK